MQSTIKDAENSNAMMKRQLKSSCNSNEEVIALRSINTEQQRKTESLKEQAADLIDQNRRLEIEKSRVESAYSGLLSDNQKLQNNLNAFLNRSTCEKIKGKCKKECSRASCCPGRILIVGGITRMKRHYKELIEAKGGEFEYHDGCVKGGRDELENRIRRCDLVFCPVNCNSHGACESVKKYCQQHGKPFKMLNSSSLSSIAKAILERANNS